MLRTIMIFPQFKNIGIIDEIRDRYDPLAKLVRPHITLVFPFESEMTNEELEEKLTSSLQNVAPFELTLHGFSKSADNYLFLDIEKGKEIIEAIHDELYSKHFKEFYLDIPYIPHMTVGKLDSQQELIDAYESVKNIEVSFETIVDKVSVEVIGEHEESIIAIEKMLADPFTWYKAPVTECLEIRQVYGVVFSNDGRVLLRIEDGRYKLTGGRPEKGESFEETLRREYIEELNVELTDIHYLGYLLAQDHDEKYAQVRMIARIKDIGESCIDPDRGKMYGRKLVAIDSVKDYLSYGDEAGNQMLEDAIIMAKEKYGLDTPYSDDDNDLILVEPSAEMKDSALEYKGEHFAFGDMQVHGSGGLAFYDDYNEWLKHIDAIRVPTSERPIQTSTFFSKRVSDGKLIGCIKIHHSLTDDIRNGGNIAYGIRPSERKKGYGKKQLQLGLAFAKQKSIEQVIIACDKENAASATTAKSCGGLQVNEFVEDGVIKQHFAIDLKWPLNPVPQCHFIEITEYPACHFLIDFVQLLELILAFKPGCSQELVSQNDIGNGFFFIFR